MSESIRGDQHFSLLARLLDLLIKRFFGTMRHFAWHLVLLIAAVAADFLRFGGAAFKDHAWEATIPIVWVLCGIVVFHSIQAARELIQVVRSETSAGSTEIEGMIYTAEKAKFRMRGESPKAQPFLRVKVWGTASVLIVICLFGSVMVWLKAKEPAPLPTPAPVPTPQLEISPPNISAQLVIDSVKGDDIDFHLQVENIGSPEISELQCQYQTSGMISGDVVPFAPRSLRKGQRLTIPGEPVNGLKKKRVLFSDLTYKGSLNGMTAGYTSKYKFILPPGALVGKSIDPSEREDLAGNLGDKDLVKGIVSVFAGPVGTLILAFPERNNDGSPNQILLINTHRAFGFNGTTGMVAFRTDALFGSTKTIQQQVGTGITPRI
jgi:hypothetical protein